MLDTLWPGVFRSLSIRLAGWLALLTLSLVPIRPLQAQSEFQPSGQPGAPSPADSWYDPYAAPVGDYGQLWRASADLILLDRTASGPQTLILQQFGGIELLSAEQLTFNGELGPRVSLIREGDGWDLEIVHFHIAGWSATAARTAPPTIVYPGSNEPNDGFNKFSGEMRFTAGSQLFNTEINFGVDLGPVVRALAGFRWIEFRDEVQGVADDGPNFPIYVFTNNNVNNHLYGGQLGLDVLVLDSGVLRLNAVLKAGVFGNGANSTTTMSDGSFLEQVDGSSRPRRTEAPTPCA